ELGGKSCHQEPFGTRNAEAKAILDKPICGALCADGYIPDWFQTGLWRTRSSRGLLPGWNEGAKGRDTFQQPANDAQVGRGGSGGAGGTEGILPGGLCSEAASIQQPHLAEEDAIDEGYQGELLELEVHLKLKLLHHCESQALAIRLHGLHGQVPP
ncbi:Hypothetical predicted protein, partial [Marmota monax]